MPQRHSGLENYRYGFNGHEKDDEVKNITGTHYDFGARVYDSRLGRFFSTDPWESKYPWQTPYAYFANSPISTIDWKGFGDGKGKGRGEGKAADDKHQGGESKYDVCSGVYTGQVWQCQTVNEDGTVNNDNGWVSVGDWVSTDNTSLVINPAYYSALEESKNQLFGPFKSIGNGSYIAGGIAVGRHPLTLAAGAGVMIYSLVYSYNNPIAIPEPFTITSDNVDIPFAIPINYAVADDGVSSKPDNGLVTLFRGVPSDNKWGVLNPAYPSSVLGTAIPQGGSSGSVDANEGLPSNFTFWSTNPLVAYKFATQGMMGIGTVITIQVPWGEVFPNSSPDKYNEGEVQIFGPKTGIPVPVFRN